MPTDIRTDLSKINVVILCGGLGKRLRPVVFGRPKVLAKIGNTTILDILMINLLVYGFKSIILSVGYLKEQIKNRFSFNKNYDCIVRFSEEEEPLGTGGALKKAKPLIRSSPFMVMNGDSICKIDFRSFIDFHVEKKSLLSIVLARSRATQDYGSVNLNSSQRIVSFNEKVCTQSDLINAGVYAMEKDIFCLMHKGNQFSLERDVFPQIINRRCYGFLTESELIDIGTPERYKKAKNMIEREIQSRKGMDNANKFW